MRPMRVYTLYVNRVDGSTTISTRERPNELPIGSSSKEADLRKLARNFNEFLRNIPKDSTLVTGEVIVDAVDKFLRQVPCAA